MVQGMGGGGGGQGGGGERDEMGDDMNMEDMFENR